MGLMKWWAGVTGSGDTVGLVHARSEEGARGHLQRELNTIATFDSFTDWQGNEWKVVQVDPKTGKKIEPTEDTKS